MGPAQSRKVLNRLYPAVLELQSHEAAKCAKSHLTISHQVEEDALRPIIRTAPVLVNRECGCHSDHHVSGVADRRISHQSLEILLQESQEVAPDHGRSRDDPRE